MNTVARTPADDLEGVVLESGWRIGKRVLKKIGGSGGNFGICYLAEREGVPAFVKAVDFRHAFSQANFVRAIAELANHSIWEKQVLEYCREHGLTQIVKLIHHEEILLPQANGDQTQRVSCLVMEMGSGDLRGQLGGDTPRADSWKLYVARDVALALDQLHRRGIVHLDVKPSNVIAVSDPSGKRPSMKLGDLGRVVRKGTPGPFDAMLWPGDINYRPPEKWYGYQPPQWNDNREAADAFMLGGLLVFLFTGVSLITVMQHEIPDAYKPGPYRGEFDSSLLDVLNLAHAQCMATYVKPSLPPSVAEELMSIISQLTDPDPTKRGDPKARQQKIVGIDRFHQKLLRMAQRLELIETRAGA